MKKADYPAPIKELVAELKRLPGIGPRSAERIALWLVQSRDARPKLLATALERVGTMVQSCPRCGFFTSEGVCAFCTDTTRTEQAICVVEQATDILALERTGLLHGSYHALGGRISPLDHIGPEDLRISALIERVRIESPGEIILALGSDVEGEATASYIAELLKNAQVQITRIAQGLPVGGGLESADEMTLSRALSGRRQIA